MNWRRLVSHTLLLGVFCSSVIKGLSSSKSRTGKAKVGFCNAVLLCSKKMLLGLTSVLTITSAEKPPSALAVSGDCSGRVISWQSESLLSIRKSTKADQHLISFRNEVKGSKSLGLEAVCRTSREITQKVSQQLKLFSVTVNFTGTMLKM